jgi:deoxycytidylate deaminase
VFPPLTLIPSPELIVGLVAPIGVDLDVVTKALVGALSEMRYAVREFRVTDLMRDIPIGMPIAASPFIQSYKDRIAYANRVRECFGSEALAALTITALRAFRRKTSELTPEATGSAERDLYLPLSAHAYILRQFKRPEEITLLRRVYGRQFILISAFAPPDIRKSVIAEKESRSNLLPSSSTDGENRANDLVAQDARELQTSHGQNVRDAFPLADVIVDATSSLKCEQQIRRFIQLLFGSNKITPTHDEYGMYIAKTASLRTADLSRQVGAAIFTSSGEIATLGTNEVPKSGGGTYWADDPNDHRDWVKRYDPNNQRQIEILSDLLLRLKSGGHLSSTLSSAPGGELALSLLSSGDENSVAGSMLMDLLEFGRIIHAEMSAITDAARKGIPIKDGSLYCTTFPCHICAKRRAFFAWRRGAQVAPFGFRGWNPRR